MSQASKIKIKRLWFLRIRKRKAGKVNMQNYILSCESTVDLTKEYLAQREIAHIGYPFELDGKCYLDDFWNSLSYEEFYCAMSRGAESKTAQINAYEFELYFEAF